jgi:hypothetical protein
MVRYFAATAAQELVMTSAAPRLGIVRDTAERHHPWLERVFLVQRIPGWGRGLTSKVIQRPDAPNRSDSPAREVDILIETTDRRVVGFEVKAATTARSDDFKGLTFLRDSSTTPAHRSRQASSYTPERTDTPSATASPHSPSATSGNEHGH